MSNITVTTKVINKDLISDEFCFVKINIKYPQCENKKIDDYIEKIVLSLEKFSVKRLLNSAIKKYTNEKDFIPYSLVVSYKTTLTKRNIFSFYFDIFVCRDKEEREIKRVPLNFDIQKSELIFPLEKIKKGKILAALDTSVKLSSSKKRFFSDASKRARKYFKKTNALLTESGIYITYDSGILAPHEAGPQNLLCFTHPIKE
ncbi:MAG: hypothetical protein IJO74_00885 [Clostridia bacterium]|nr:hypothetical protein [Clostridia bacterium]